MANETNNGNQIGTEKKEGFFSRKKREAKEARQKFETEHPKAAKALKIGGGVVAGAAILFLGVKIGGRRKGAAVEQLPELPDAGPDLLEMSSDAFEDAVTDIPDVVDAAVDATDMVVDAV